MHTMHNEASILVASGRTMIGAALLRRLRQKGFQNARCENDANLARQDEVESVFREAVPEFVFLVGGKSGGIAANRKCPATLMYNNLAININVIDAAHRHGVRKLLYLASSCCYPKLCPQPMRIEHLFSGELEPTSAAYAVAKLAGIVQCQAYQRQHGVSFITVIPADVYGPGEDLNNEDSHVVLGLMQRMYAAKRNKTSSVTIWGSGLPRRELLFVDDLADACIFVCNRYEGCDPINIGSGQVMSIREIAETVREVVGFSGELVLDSSKPDGMPFKALDSSVLVNHGWRPGVALTDGLMHTFRWLQEQTEILHG